jgi:hypothetical protein
MAMPEPRRSLRIKDIPLPPRGFDPLTASHDTLIGYGFPHRPRDPGQRRLWEWVLSHPIRWKSPLSDAEPLSAPPRSGRRTVNLDNPFTWCGAIAYSDVFYQQPSFVNVSAIWTVPYMRQNPRAAGTYNCTSWVGLDDGAEGGNLWQAGVKSTVDPNGTGSDTPQASLWCEVVDAETFEQSGTKLEPLPVPIPLAIQPGDQVVVVLGITPPEEGAISTTGSYWAANLTRLEGVLAPVEGLPAFLAANAEWIVERQTDEGTVNGMVVDRPQELGDFGTITFDYCSANTADKGMVDLVSSTYSVTTNTMQGDNGGTLATAQINSPTQLTCTWDNYH